MAIGFRSVGTRLKTDVTVSGGSHSVSLPAGHASGDLLIMFVLTDANTNTTETPSGWTQLSFIANGSSIATPYTPRPRLKIFYRIDNGALGSSVALSFDTRPWPTGDPSVLAFVAAYTGCDTSGPIERYEFLTTVSTTAAQAHPQITTSVANDWLITYRASSTDQPVATYTASGGTNVERVDDSDSIQELSCALYDSNAGLTAGVQTQRTTTASRAATYGSLLVSIAIKPAAVAGSAFASPTTAEGTASALDATVVTEDGSWDLCGSVPDYRSTIDWAGDGYFADSLTLDETYATDAFGRTVSNGWGSTDTGQAWASTGGSAAEYAVGSGVGTIGVTTVNSSRVMRLTSPSADMDLQCDFATGVLATGGSHYVGVLARYIDINNYFQVRCQMSTAQVMTVSLRRRLGGTETELASMVTGLTHAAGTFYSMRLRIVGTTMWGKVWAVGSPEPGWQISAVDSALTAAGAHGIRAILDGANTNTPPVVFSYDNFRSSPALNEDDVTDDIISDTTITYGRDQDRQLSPASVGNAAFVLNNVSRKYSPEYAPGSLFGSLDPARPMQTRVMWGGNEYPLFTGRVDDFNIKADMNDRTVDFTFLDGLSLLQGVKLSTGVYQSLRTGEVIDTILDLAGWTGGRDIDVGATVVKFWWAEGQDAFNAVQDVVKSEGPPAIAYVAPDGTFVFRDRHHRLQRTESIESQATFSAAALGDCTVSPPATGFSFTKPFTYAHGWRDIVNSVSFDVSERAVDGALTAVWTSSDTYTLGIGEAVEINVSGSDPFLGAVAPVQGTDFTKTGAGTAIVTLDRDSGASVKITLLAAGGSVTVSGLQLRAHAIPVRRTIKVIREDTGSITKHGERAYPDDAPWANANDAAAIANMVLLHYAQRRPTVQLRIPTSDPAHFLQVLQRTVSDRIHIVNGELGLDDDFFVERVTHTIVRRNMVGRAPVHYVVLGCEKDLDNTANPFRFDVRGSGFDEGVFDPIQADGADTVFIFDHPTQGKFDTGLFGT